MGNHNISLINGGSVIPAKSRAYVNGMFLVASSQNLADSKCCRNVLCHSKEGSEAEQAPGRVNPASRQHHQGPGAYSLPRSALALFSGWLGEGDSGSEPSNTW